MEWLEYGIPNLINAHPIVAGIAIGLAVVYFLATAAAKTLEGMDRPVPAWLEFAQSFVDQLFLALARVVKRSLPTGDSRKP